MYRNNDPVRGHLIAKIGGNESAGNTEVADTYRRELATHNLEEHIRAVVDSAPPLTNSQRLRLAALLAPDEDEER